MLKGPTQSITFGEMPASSSPTSVSMLPRKMLTGWKRAAEIQLTSVEE